MNTMTRTLMLYVVNISSLVHVYRPVDYSSFESNSSANPFSSVKRSTQDESISLPLHLVTQAPLICVSMGGGGGGVEGIDTHLAPFDSL